MSMTMSEVDINYPVRLACTIFVLLLWIFCGYLFVKERNNLPFKQRVKPALVVNGIACIINVINNLAVFIYREDGRLSCSCPEYTVVYTSFSPMIAISLCYRTFVLLVRHDIQQKSMQLGNYYISGFLPKGIERVEQIKNSWSLRYRYMIRDGFVMKVMAGTFLCTFGGAIIVWMAPEDEDNGMFAGILIVFFSLLTGCLSYALRDNVKDNYGIGSELETLWITLVVSLVVFGVFEYGFWNTAMLYSVYTWLQLFVYSVIAVVTVIIPIQREKRKPQAIHTLMELHMSISPHAASRTMPSSTVSHAVSTQPMSEQTELQMDSRPGATLHDMDHNRVFDSIICERTTFKGIISSEQGYLAFLEFAQTEFTAESLLFWLHSRTLNVFVLNVLQAAAETVVECNNDELRKTARTPFEPHNYADEVKGSRVTSLQQDRRSRDSVTRELLSHSAASPRRPSLPTPKAPPLTAFEVKKHFVKDSPQAAVSFEALGGERRFSETMGVAASLVPQPIEQAALMGVPTARLGFEQHLSKLSKMHEVPPDSADLSSPDLNTQSSITGHAVADASVVDVGMGALFDMRYPFADAARHIYTLYVQPGAANQANLSEKIRCKIQETMLELNAACIAEPELTEVSIGTTDYVLVNQHRDFFLKLADTFQTASTDLITTLHHHAFARFKNSPQFMALLVRMKAMKKWQEQERGIQNHLEPQLV